MSETATMEAPVKVKKEKAVKPFVACWCGCGGLTKGRFVPGHDSKFHGRAKQVARGQLDKAEQLALLPHDEARAEFEKHIALELPHVPKFLKEEQEKAVRKAEKEKAKSAAADVKAASAKAAAEVTPVVS